MSIELPDREYPFADSWLPLSQLQMVEAPPDLQRLFVSQAEASGITLIRDKPVELACKSDDFPDARFLIWWPADSDRIHVLVPKDQVRGCA